MPYVNIVIPAGTAIGKTVDARIDRAPGRVTLLSEQMLRIEPDNVATIVNTIVQDGRMTLHTIAARRKSGAPA